MNSPSKIEIRCADDFKLSGNLYQVNQPKAAILIAPATGIKKEFYHSFAQFLADNGYSVLTFDYRGIGESKLGSINNINASLANWGRLDVAGALETLKSFCPASEYHLIGHSAGGNLVGLMENKINPTIRNLTINNFVIATEAATM